MWLNLFVSGSGLSKKIKNDYAIKIIIFYVVPVEPLIATVPDAAAAIMCISAPVTL